jgi:hypothetical protein
VEGEGGIVFGEEADPLGLVGYNQYLVFMVEFFGYMMYETLLREMPRDREQTSTQTKHALHSRDRNASKTDASVENQLHEEWRARLDVPKL